MSNPLILEYVQENQLDEVTHKLLGTNTGRLLRFQNAPLARAETNLNGDAIDDQGVAEIAASLANLPIDLEHDKKTIVGYYTGAHADKGAVLTDGYIFSERHPDAALGVLYGTMKQSIEADAKEAVCSVCGGVFTTPQGYCAHLNNRSATGAVRKLRGLKATGGALVKNPAGTRTQFDPQGLEIIASFQGARELSFNEQDERIKGQFYKQFPQPPDWDHRDSVRETYPGYVIVECYDGKAYKVTYKTEESDRGEVLIFQAKPDWTAVEVAYVTASTQTFMDELEYDYPRLFGKVLTSDERNSMDDKNFALIQYKPSKRNPGKKIKVRRFPIGDRAHAANALARLSNAKDLSPEERKQVKRKASAALKRFGGEPGEDEKKNKSSASRAALSFVANANADNFAANSKSVLPLRSPVLAPYLYHEELSPALEKIAAMTDILKKSEETRATTEAALQETVAALKNELAEAKERLTKLETPASKESQISATSGISGGISFEAERKIKKERKLEVFFG